jgi:hypothetical protein
MSLKRKCNSLTIEEKKLVLEAVDRGDKRKKEVAAQFKIPGSTLSTILKDRDKILSSPSNAKKVKRFRQAEHPELEKCLFTWFVQCREKQVPISGPVLQKKAEQFARKMNIPIENFAASNGWLGNFKKRHDLHFKSVCGESAAVDTEKCDAWKSELPTLLKNYRPEDTFNADETGLFFKCLPNKTLALKNDDCHGGKQSKERITVLLCTNMTGTEKLTPLVIGKSKKLRCFVNVKSLPLQYMANKKAWMTIEFFDDWLAIVDKKMTAERRKIIILVDNCTAHVVRRELKSVKVEFFPANATSVLQPLDLGIIQNTKVLYRQQIIEKMIFDIDEGKETSIDLLLAFRMLDKAWRKVSPLCIQKCFLKAGFQTLNIDFENDDETIFHDAEELWSELLERKSEGFGDVDCIDFLFVDDGLPVSAMLSDDEIIEECCNENEDVDEAGGHEDVEETEPKSYRYRDLTAAIELLRGYFETSEGTTSATFNALSEIEITVERKKYCNLVQKKISDFF